jgi:hypothetical protein
MPTAVVSSMDHASSLQLRRSIALFSQEEKAKIMEALWTVPRPGCLRVFHGWVKRIVTSSPPAGAFEAAIVPP